MFSYVCYYYSLSFCLQPSFQRKQQQFNGGSATTSPTPYSNYTSATSTLNRNQGSQAQHGNNPGNMTELDTLLQDLKSSKYGQSLERRQHSGKWEFITGGNWI